MNTFNLQHMLHGCLHLGSKALTFFAKSMKNMGLKSLYRVFCYFRGVGRGCRWCAGLVSWWGIRRTWLPMTLTVGWCDGILDRLFHWQSVSFFVWIVSSFCCDSWVLRSPPCCFEISRIWVITFQRHFSGCFLSSKL